jgi:phosphohistidine phosphatase
MNVYIFRHAKADFGAEGKKEDPPLSSEGANDVAEVVRLANARLGFSPTAIVSSPLVRAKQTAELARGKLGLKTKAMVDECLYGDKMPSDVFTFLSGFGAKDNVVLVSHMPLIHELLYEMIGGRAEIELTNGSIAGVEFSGKAAKGKGKLTWLIHPPT